MRDLYYWSFTALLLLLVSVWYSRTLDQAGRPFDHFGFAAQRRSAWMWLAGVAVGAVLVVLPIAAIALFGRYSAQIVPEGIRWSAVIAQLWILIAGALAEELAFRGYAFQRLVDSVGAGIALALVSLLFGAGHLGNPNVSALAYVNTVLIGIFLSVAFLRTRSLWFVWGLHFGWNVILGTAFGLRVSGLEQFAVVVKGNAEGPTWLTGGGYGIEAGAVTTGVIVLALAVLANVRLTPPDVGTNGRI